MLSDGISKGIPKCDCVTKSIGMEGMSVMTSNVSMNVNKMKVILPDTQAYTICAYERKNVHKPDTRHHHGTRGMCGII